MNRDQEAIIAELTTIRNCAKNVLDIVRDKKPLSHKNSSAVRKEMDDVIRHMKRNIDWIQEDQGE